MTCIVGKGKKISEVSKIKVCHLQVLNHWTSIIKLLALCHVNFMVPLLSQYANIQESDRLAYWIMILLLHYECETREGMRDVA